MLRLYKTQHKQSLGYIMRAIAIKSQYTLAENYDAAGNSYCLAVSHNVAFARLRNNVEQRITEATVEVRRFL